MSIYVCIMSIVGALDEDTRVFPIFFYSTGEESCFWDQTPYIHTAHTRLDFVRYTDCEYLFDLSPHNCHSALICSSEPFRTSNFRTLSSPFSPPQATQPLDFDHDIDFSGILCGMAI